MSPIVGKSCLDRFDGHIVVVSNLAYIVADGKKIPSERPYCHAVVLKACFVQARAMRVKLNVPGYKLLVVHEPGCLTEPYPMVVPSSASGMRWGLAANGVSGRTDGLRTGAASGTPPCNAS